MDKFPSDFREPAPVDKVAAERERIFKAITHGQDFYIYCDAKKLMLELHERFPNTFQMWKESVSGLDNRPSGSYSWVTIDGEELAPDYRIAAETRFRVKDYKPLSQ